MAQEKNAIILGIMAMSMVIAIAGARSLTVGDTSGWTYNVSSWPQGKTFAAGDNLVFKYASAAHNVALVSKAGYESCQVIPSSAPTFQSGNDQIKLKKGDNYFICTFPGHCQGGMKIAVHAN